MDLFLKSALNTATIKDTGESGGGCINQGRVYEIDSGKIFVKLNKKPESRTMFEGEYEGLKTIAATKTVNVPSPIILLDNPNGGAIIVLEYINMKRLEKFQNQLGEKLAMLHLQNMFENEKLNKTYVGNEEKQSQYIREFGFHTTTCCGFLPQDNSWCNDWQTFFTRQRLEHQINLVEKSYGDREVLELWSQLNVRIHKFFKNIIVEPSLLHGDLWGGNVAETSEGPVIFDPAVFYGHHEYELAISGMFGGFNKSFYDAYHKVIPRAAGFEIRQKLYQLFHYLNHWNHFGTGYRSSSISIMKSLLKEKL